jgi:tetratricopeptide (TPR) repeat protein
MEKVLRMIEGDQTVAALDRINTLMPTLPSDAWLLAMKCDLLIRTNEIEALEETSAKFIRLRPDNPLAGLYRSIVAVIRGNIEEAAGKLLSSLASSSESVHPMFVNCSYNLIEAMMMRSMTLPALMHSELLIDVSGESSSVAEQIFETLVSKPENNVLVRDAIPTPRDYEDEQWSERFQEAHVLLTNYQIAQARTKLEALQREYGDQPAILVGLVHCRLLLADQSGAASLCDRLADNQSISEPQRIYWKALAIEFDSVKAGVSVKDEIASYELDNEKDIEETLNSSSEFMPIQQDNMRQMVMNLANEEVPPKAMFVAQLPLSEFGVDCSQFNDSNPTVSGTWIALFGRQTDKAPRVITVDTKFGYRKLFTEKLHAKLALNSDKREVLLELDTVYHQSIAAPVVVEKEVPADSKAALAETVRTFAGDLFKQFPLEIFGSQTIGEASSDPKNAILIQALLLHWEACGTAPLKHEHFRELAKSMGLELPLMQSTEDTFDLVGAASYYWTDLETIDPVTLNQLMQSAMVRSIASVSDGYSEAAGKMDWPEELKKSAQFITLNLKLQAARDGATAEKILLDIYNTGSELGASVGKAALQRFEILQQLGRAQEAQQFLQLALRDHPNDPALMQFMQMAMMRMQQMQSEGGGQGNAADLMQSLAKHSSSRAAAAPPASGLFDGSADSEPAPPAGGEGSGLWLPGQD